MAASGSTRIAPLVQSKESRRLCGATPFSLRLEVQRGSTILGFASRADADAILIAVAFLPCVPRRDARSRPGSACDCSQIPSRAIATRLSWFMADYRPSPKNRRSASEAADVATGTAGVRVRDAALKPISTANLRIEVAALSLILINGFAYKTPFGPGTSNARRPQSRSCCAPAGEAVSVTREHRAVDFAREPELRQLRTRALNFPLRLGRKLWRALRQRDPRPR